MKSLIGATVAAVILALTITMAANWQDQKPDSNIRSFAPGSIVSITMWQAPNAAIYIEEPEIKKIGETWFIVGKYAAVPGFPAPLKAVSVWVAINSITTMDEYKNADDLQKAFPVQTQQNS